ncbi:MAG: prolipoprotein diacylglyceryl transferase [Methylacidiphilales bacterium]|nr:prolipoprotein diacylglyceryl transferase [Candidatus Methylacidiphilales bacterium]
MFLYPAINPIAFSIGKISIHWYGIMYVLGFVAFLYLAKKQVKNDKTELKTEDIDFILQYSIVGVILGGRLGYCIFYQFAETISNPLFVFKIHEGGMSFHGGLLGVILSLFIFSRLRNFPFYLITDLVARYTPIGLGLGRVGNFINGELYGRPTSSDVPWSFVFPHVDLLPRHPSMLYEAILEGAVLYALLYLSNTRKYLGRVSILFLLYYSSMRFVIEFYREPDAHLGLFYFNVTLGQILCIGMFIAGLSLYWYQAKRVWKII